MSKKIIILIIASIFSLIALSLIQGYLIKNTYELKKEAFIEKAGKQLGKIDDYNSPLDSVNDIWTDIFIKDLDEYSLKNTNKEKLLKRLKVITDSLNPRFIREYDKILSSKKLAYNLKFHKTLKTIIITDNLKRDTIFKSSSEPFTLLGYAFEDDQDLHTGNSVWQTERSFQRVTNGEEKKVRYHLYFESHNYINIDDWSTIIFSEMKGLLLLSFIIFLFVIAVLYYSIKNLITQKKIADIKTDFINNITHELKTPLATLSLATKLLKKQENTNTTTITTIHTIDRQNARLQKLIDQVLDNSLGYKEIIVHKEKVVFGSYINSVLNDFKMVVDQQEIDFLNNNVERHTTVFLDRFYITTAILNILENAVKYGGTKLKVNILEVNQNVEIHIKDNGIGISKKYQKHIFDKFFRAENQEVHNVKGLGLGLYYSNQILKAHHGTISVNSEKGKGTTFIISIPKV